MLKNYSILALFFCINTLAFAQQDQSENTYKKRILETTEIDLLSSYYGQQGNNAAVTGGLGTEELTDATGTIVVSIPINADDVLTIDAGVSAYTSASSSNINPFDGSNGADIYQASSGASRSDTWANLTGSYTHNSDDRNKIWSAKASVSSEYDYFSIGFGGSYTRLFNDKNTELSIKANVYLDTWTTIYPIELRPGAAYGDSNYNPTFTPFNDIGRNSYSLGFGFSKILSKNLQGSLALDLVQQSGLLSTPFQRVYFSDSPDVFFDNFQLADDVERLPNNRFKIAAGGRLNYYINAAIVLRSYYRYYTDDWGINSHTASLEIPVKLGDKFTVYPSYRYYTQTAADQFGAYETHLSTDTFYTSDYDLSKYNANQFGFGVNYTDIFAKFHLLQFGLKSIDLKYYNYKRNTGLSSNIITAGFKFVQD
ncbi:putative protein DUF3570 [Leeuwenhoekiella aestuarii]|uniref:DUF3570 domain-containing protein n=1 Tax=Leeuwenhoekiella aestuarii TaxID=2249426 RepID=A0A4Q0NZL9_9FLAO|nr:DUF3570 domain-containing protein [Leeuwenhoekiella aestuarii]RXG18035.1 putative protein DUF3570 [Leeuwenhoekiella aestuarii]RXG19341.1 putative protein DUF3570 [Leeuwenhoekiella aestuarii]